MFYNIVSIVPQPPDGRGGKRHCRAAFFAYFLSLLTESRAWCGGATPRFEELKLQKSRSGVPGADAPGSVVKRLGSRGAGKTLLCSCEVRVQRP